MSIVCAVTHRKEDAARKWCPFAWVRNNVRYENELSCNEDESNGEKSHCNDSVAIDCSCLTTRCMAWIDETDYFNGVSLGRCGLINLTKP